jgi:tetratricopeptide (TPR) repeat protein
MAAPQVDPTRHCNILGATDALAALKAASDACHAAPNRPEAHYAYGQAWSALGNHPNAERAFAAALQLAPRWPDAWVNYGIARYRQGESIEREFRIVQSGGRVRHILNRGEVLLDEKGKPDQAGDL